MHTSFERNIKLLKWFTFCGSLQFYRSIPILYFAQVSGSYALAASLLSLVMLTAALAEIPTGVFSDMIGRQKTLFLGTVCGLSAVILYAVGGSYLILAAGAILDGLSRAFYSGNNDALLYDLLAQNGATDAYAAYYGELSSLAGLSALIAALSGSVIAHRSFPAAMWCSAIPLAANLVISLQIPESQRENRPPRRLRSHLREAFRLFRTNPQLRLLSLSHILGNGFGNTAFEFQAAVYSLVWPIWAIGLARAMGELLAAVGFRFGDRIIRRFGAGRVILVDSIYGWLANIVGALFPSVLTPLIISSSVLFYGPGTTAAESLKQQAFSDEQRATMASMNALGASLLYAIFSVLIGLVSDQIGPFRALLIVQLFITICVFLSWRLYQLLRQ
jgi:MFS family permease